MSSEPGKKPRFRALKTTKDKTHKLFAVSAPCCGQTNDDLITVSGAEEKGGHQR